MGRRGRRLNIQTNMTDDIYVTDVAKGNNLMATKLPFIVSGIMASSILAGLLKKKLVRPEQIVASPPRANRRDELFDKYKIRVFENNVDAVRSTQDSETAMVLLCVKPQRLPTVLRELKGVVESEQLVLSVVAGAKMETISAQLENRKIIRAMPNTPAQIGRGITAWTCTDEVSEYERSQVKDLLTTLRRELFVETENMIE